MSDAAAWAERLDRRGRWRRGRRQEGAAAGGQIARAAGTYAQLIAKEGDFVTLKLPSNEVRLVNKNCYFS